VFWSEDPGHPGVVTPVAAIGFALARRLSGRAGGDRDAAMAASEQRAGKRFGVRSLEGWTTGERLWWRRWAPLLDALPGIGRWSAKERRKVVAIVRAKGGVRESEYARLFDAHPRLAAAVLSIGGRGPRMR